MLIKLFFIFLKLLIINYGQRPYNQSRQYTCLILVHRWQSIDGSPPQNYKIYMPMSVIKYYRIIYLYAPPKNCGNIIINYHLKWSKCHLAPCILHSSHRFKRPNATLQEASVEKLKNLSIIGLRDVWMVWSLPPMSFVEVGKKRREQPHA